MRENYRNQLAVLTSAWQAALNAADPGAALQGNLPAVGSGRLVLVAAGKAAPAMAATALAHYRAAGTPLSGVVAAPVERQPGCGELQWFKAAHPLPDRQSVAAGEAVLGMLEGLSGNDTVLLLLSGGASSLLTLPAGVDLAELRRVSDALMRSGADINALNTVRRKLCRLKGGGLARLAAPARVVARIVSDVVGDDLAAIGSGPTVADPDSAADAIALLERQRVDSPAVRAWLDSLAGQPARATPDCDNRVIAGARTSLEAAAAATAAAGLAPHLLSESMTGDSSELAVFHAGLVRDAIARGEPCALVSGGETTVNVPPGAGGTGGRNSTFALKLLLELWGVPGWTALVADTDGKDGSSDAAGAIVTPDLCRLAERADAAAALAAADSGGWFSRNGHAFMTGPTGTNVNDLRIILVGWA